MKSATPSQTWCAMMTPHASHSMYHWGHNYYSQLSDFRALIRIQISFEPEFGAYQSLAQVLKVPISRIFSFLQF